MIGPELPTGHEMIWGSQTSVCKSSQMALISEAMEAHSLEELSHLWGKIFVITSERLPDYSIPLCSLPKPNSNREAPSFSAILPLLALNIVNTK